MGCITYLLHVIGKWLGAVWAWLADPANAATIQAGCAAAMVVLTGAIALFMRRQTAVLSRQTGIQEQQTQTQNLLAWLEYAPIIAAEFAEDYDADGNRIVLRNGGRGPAHNIRGYLWVRTGAQRWEPLQCGADPANLNAGDTGEAGVDLDAVRKLRPSFKGVELRDNDLWVLHYGGVLGGTWHTTSNIDDKGRYLPLRYFRSWSPADWCALPAETRGLCWVCRRDEETKAAAERVYRDWPPQTPGSEEPKA